MKLFTKFAMLLMLCAALVFSACDDGKGSSGGGGGTGDTVVNISAINGVTPPAYNETPVTTITETAQYTGLVSWNPDDDPFEGETVYTATITLTPKTGYILTGVDEDFFGVAGADTVSNAAGSGVVTAVFPATEAVPPTVIDISEIDGVTPPAYGETPVTAITETDQYTGTVTWSGSPVTFAATTVYTATITLTAKSGYTLTGVIADFFTVAYATSVTNDADSGVVTAVFPETEAAPISISIISGVTEPVVGATPLTTITETAQFTGTVSWDPGDDHFEGETVYTATITLTAKTGYTLTGVSANFFTVAYATSVTNDADSGEVTAVFPKTLLYSLRDTGPAGGLIFYIEYNGDGTHTYYEAAPNTWNGGTEDPEFIWQNPRVLIGGDAQGTAMGTGMSNTTAIVTWLNANGQTGRAAQVVDSLSFGGYDDWFLPSQYELYMMFVYLHEQAAVGGFANDDYWSSSEGNLNQAWDQDFSNGEQYELSKSNNLRVRPARAFIH